MTVTHERHTHQTSQEGDRVVQEIYLHTHTHPELPAELDRGAGSASLLWGGLRPRGHLGNTRSQLLMLLSSAYQVMSISIQHMLIMEELFSSPMYGDWGGHEVINSSSRDMFLRLLFHTRLAETLFLWPI